MSQSKMDEIKHKVVGNLEEVAGKMTGDQQLEVKGKVKQGVGKFYEVADDYMHEAEGLKDTVVGTVKEKAGQLTDDQPLELRGRLQKDKGDKSFSTKLLYSLGILAVIVLVMNLFTDEE